MVRGAQLALALLGILVARGAYAQLGGTSLVGQVVDASTKKPVADVVVTATSPALQGEQVVVTNAAGDYRIPQLSAGTYTLRFEKESYRPYSRSGIELRAETTIRLNVELLPETAGQEEIVVVGKPPTVDVGSTTTGAQITTEFMQSVPLARNARTFEAVAQVAPGVQTDFNGTAISGATSPENNFVVDGVSTFNPAFGGNGSPISIEFVDQVNVITGGFMPEYGRTTGGAVAAFTKSGGNEFHGSVWGIWTPGALQGNTPQVTVAGGTFAQTTTLYNRWDVGATLGGYIIKDRLWFFAGFNPSQVKNERARTTNYFDSNGNSNLVPDSGINTFATTTNYQYIGKLTLLLNPDNRLVLTGLGDTSPSVSFPSLGSDQTRLTAVNNSFSNFDMSLKYQGAFLEKRLLLDVTAGWHNQTATELPTDGSDVLAQQSAQTGLAAIPPVRIRQGGVGSLTPQQYGRAIPAQCVPGTGGVAQPCPFNGANTYDIYAPFAILFDETMQNYQGMATVTYLAQGWGSHVIKAGIDVADMVYTDVHGYGGGNLYRGSTTSTSYTVYRGYGVLLAPDQQRLFNLDNTTKTVSIGGFIQDSWAIFDKVTLNIGIRYDDQTIYYTVGNIGLALPNQWSPRIGVIWDPTYQGRSKIYANYATYYENLPLDISNRSFFPGEQSVTSVRRGTLNINTQPTRCNPIQDPNYKTTCLNPANGASTFALSSNQAWQVNSGAGATYPDPNISPQSSSEVVVGGEYEVLPNARAGLTFTRRWLNKVIEDMSNDNANTYFLGNPGYGIAANFPKAYRNYTAVSIYFTKNFADLWQAQVSYTYQSLQGNYEGLIASNYGQLDPNITANFDLRKLLANSGGPLPGNITSTIKVFASKEWVILPVLSLTLGGAYVGHSGPPYSYLGADNLYGNGVVYITQRGGAGALPWINSIDGRFGVNWRLSKDMVLSVAVDVFNILNSAQVQTVDENYTFASVLPIVNGTPQQLKATPSALRYVDGTQYSHADDNLNYGHPACGNAGCVAQPAYQPPRQWRFSARLSF